MTKKNMGRPVRDVGALRALAHPLRMRLLYALGAAGSATVSQLGEAVEESPALVSYHLAQLAKHGFVEDAPTHERDGREHAYRRTPGGISWSAADFADAPSGREVADAAMHVVVDQQLARLQAWRTKQHVFDSAWTEASLSFDSMLHLTPAQLTELGADLDALLERYKAKGTKAQRGKAGDADRQPVFLFLHAFPTKP